MTQRALKDIIFVRGYEAREKNMTHRRVRRKSFCFRGSTGTLSLREGNNIPYGGITCLMSSVAEPVLFGRSRCEGPAPAPPYIDKTEEILNDILFVCSNMD